MVAGMRTASRDRTQQARRECWDGCIRFHLAGVLVFVSHFNTWGGAVKAVVEQGR